MKDFDFFEEMAAEVAAKDQDRRRIAEAQVLKAEELRRSQAERQSRRKNVARHSNLAPEGCNSPDLGSSPPPLLGKLKRYVEHLLEPSELDQIRGEIDQKSYDELVEYYEARAEELGRYTVKQELRRMEYSVTSSSGEILKDHDKIISEFHQSTQRDEGCNQREGASAAALLWAMANQSLLADIVSVLQLHWAEPELSIAVTASRCSFIIDLRPSHLSLAVRGSLSIQTLGAADLPLELAACEVALHVCPQQRKLTQTVEKPRLRDCLIFDDEVAAVARALAVFSMHGPPPSPPTQRRQQSTSRTAPSPGSSIRVQGKAEGSKARCGGGGDGEDGLVGQLERFMNMGEESDGAAAEHQHVADAAANDGLFSGIWGALRPLG